jgi:hypothetical protein
MSSTCPRCGFVTVDQPEGIRVDTPSGLNVPPLPPEALPHPVGVCCSPFEIGQKLFWNLDLVDPDMPPVVAVFKELVTIKGADFKFVDEKWVQEGSPRATIAAIRIDKKSVHPCHEMLLDEVMERDLEVPVENLTAYERWPVLEVA